MILYFSATGNSQYVADRLASALGQEALSMVDCLRRGETSFTDDTICVVSPTYFWGLPSIVKEFLAQADLHTGYLCFLATYGTTPGASGRMAGKAIQGRAIDAFYAVRMPDTWTPIFDLSAPEKVAAFTKTTEADIDAAIRGIRQRHTNRRMSPVPPGFSRSGSHSPSTTERSGKRLTSAWRRAASAAADVRRTAPCGPSRCGSGGRSGSRRNVPCALAACTAARSSPSSTAETPGGTGSTPIPRPADRAQSIRKAKEGEASPLPPVPVPAKKGAA